MGVAYSAGAEQNVLGDEVTTKWTPHAKGRGWSSLIMEMRDASYLIIE
jgi:hypothetical protein